MQFSSLLIASCLAALGLVEAHTIITYPGWRGDNLITNDTFPYGMQWMYPCEYTSRCLSLADKRMERWIGRIGSVPE
jgi:hypothetical protein